MPRKIKRNFLFHVNKYQKKIIWPVIFASFIALVMTFYCFEFYIAQVTETSIKMFDWNISHTEYFVPLTLGGLLAILVFIIIWVYQSSNQILGPYERVIRELDQIIEGKKKGPIVARPKDEMFQDILKRINTIIAK